MPNRSAKDRKRKRREINKKLAREGRTANQHARWKEKGGSPKPTRRF